MNSEVIISGGGIIGNYLSILLNANDVRAYVIEKSQAPKKNLDKIRTVTLNKNSFDLLKKINLDVEFKPIKTIKVFDAETSGKIHFKSEDIDSDYLSYVAYFDDVNNALIKKNINNIHFGNEIIDLSYGKNNSLELLLFNKKKISTKILAGCDGKNSNVASMIGLKSISREYGQTAFTFKAETTLEDEIAYQFFSDKGIFAIMPLPKLQNDKSTHTIVWSVNDNYLLKDHENFIFKNIYFFEKKLDINIDITSKILKFNLSNHHFNNYVINSAVLIGDAAHSIHPLAGQGINLGFADAEIFCEEILNAHNTGRQINDKTVLKKYEVRRRSINQIMVKSMDIFVDMFESKSIVSRFLRSLGLKFVDKNEFLKSFFINYAGGKNKF